jgi:prephenate dehydratase
MNLIYQWIPWAYSDIACLKVKKILSKEIKDIIWVDDFKTVWNSINNNNIAVLPIENSYAWDIDENLYNFIRFDYKIIWEIDLEINHCLISKETNIKNIKEVYSHPQALAQCYNYLKKKNIKAISFWDTAWAVEMIKNNKNSCIWAIWSKLSWELHNLNILDNSIQDQKWNTTKFFVITPKKSKVFMKINKNKTSIIFETKNIPAALYKCLWAFATNNVNLTKIKSMPSMKWPFTYLFWLTFEWKINDNEVIKSLEELSFFSKQIKILWEY